MVVLINTISTMLEGSQLRDLDNGLITTFDGYGGMAYYSSENCTNVKNGLTSGCKANYEESDVKYVVDSQTENVIKKEDLKKDNLGYESRLLTKQEIDELFNFEYKYKTPSDAKMTYCGTENTPTWLFNSSFWIMDSADDGNKVYEIADYAHSLDGINVYNYSGVRPVITIKKSALQDNTNNI